jgi:hypothetical protein
MAACEDSIMFDDDAGNSLSVIVYQYIFWDAAADAMVRSDDWATWRTIRNGLGVPITESGRKVPRRLVDENGRLKTYLGEPADAIPSDMVFVWYFRACSAQDGEMKVSLRPATAEAIEAVQGQRIEETRKAIPRSLLDENGFAALVESADTNHR